MDNVTERIVWDSTEMNDGNFVLKGKIEDQTIAHFAMYPGADGTTFDRRPICLEPGDIVMKSDGNLSAVTFSGSQINSDYLIVGVGEQQHSRAYDSISKKRIYAAKNWVPRYKRYYSPMSYLMVHLSQC